MNDTHYQVPDWFTKHVFNAAVSASTRLGLSVWGSRVLEIPGRSSGIPRRTPVNLLHVDGDPYLVAARGETEWVRNLRANSNHLTLIHGRRRDVFDAVAVEDADKVRILRPYLKRWKAEVGKFFEGVGPDSSDADLAGIAPRHPVFRLTPVAGS